MSLRHILVAGFTGYGLVVLLLGDEFFGPGMATTIYAMAAASFVVALLFVINRCFALNFMIAAYVSTTFFLNPWVDRIFLGLDPQDIVYLESLRHYYDASTTTRVYLFVFLCLLGWLVGMMLAPRRVKRARATVPRLFRRLDRQVFVRGVGFWGVLVAVSVLNAWHTLRTGWGAASAGSDGEGALLLGLLNPAFVINVCLVGFVYAVLTKQAGKHYALIIPLLPSVIFGAFMGGRGALYVAMILTIFYIVVARGPQLRIRFWSATLMSIGLAAAVFIGALANVVRPLWRNNVGAPAIAEGLVDVATSGELADMAHFSVAVLAARLSDVLAPFYVINDRFVYDTWEYVNPLQIVMRTVNAMVPGEPFPGVIGMNQFFDWIYMGDVVIYNSEMWSMFAMPYLYFGFLGAPLVFCVLAVAVCGAYGSIIARMRKSPSFAVFAIGVGWALIENGTLERTISVNIWTVVLVVLIFTTLVRLADIPLGGLQKVARPRAVRA